MECSIYRASGMGSKTTHAAGFTQYECKRAGVQRCSSGRKAYSVLNLSRTADFTICR